MPIARRRYLLQFVLQGFDMFLPEKIRINTVGECGDCQSYWQLRCTSCDGRGYSSQESDWGACSCHNPLVDCAGACQLAGRARLAGRRLHWLPHSSAICVACNGSGHNRDRWDLRRRRAVAAISEERHALIVAVAEFELRGMLYHMFSSISRPEFHDVRAIGASYCDLLTPVATATCVALEAAAAAPAEAVAAAEAAGFVVAPCPYGLYRLQESMEEPTQAWRAVISTLDYDRVLLAVKTAIKNAAVEPAALVADQDHLNSAGPPNVCEKQPQMRSLCRESAREAALHACGCGRGEYLPPDMFKYNAAYPLFTFSRKIEDIIVLVEHLNRAVPSRETNGLYLALLAIKRVYR